MRQKTALKTIRLYASHAGRYPLFLLTVFVMLPVVVVAGNILLPLLYANAINKVKDLIGSQADLLDTFGTLFWQSLTLIAITWLGWRIIGFTLSVFEFRVKRDLEQSVFRKLLEHSYTFHTNSFSGSLVAQTNRLTNAFERLFDSIYFDLLILAIKLSGALIVLFMRAPVAAWIMLGWALFFMFSMAAMQFKKMPLAKAASAADSKVTAALADALTNMFAIKTSGQHTREEKHFNTVSQRRYKIALRDWFVTEWIFAFQGFMMFAIEFALIWVTISLALQGSIGLGDIILVQFYLMSITGSLWNFGRVIRNIERSLADASEMTDIYYKPIGVRDVAKPKPFRSNRGHIVFEDVTFRYKDDGLKLFDNLTLDIKPGEKIGLVGPSGGGKTTITKLLLRLLDIQHGKILIDGQDIAMSKQDGVRQAIAYVPQEPVLFHRSLAENIAYEAPAGHTRDDILHAAKAAHADQFISALPDGFDTLVGERGIKLSGGQRQRIVIARAMLKDAPILLLDEATSALDSASEVLIQDALFRLMQNKTSIVIAHRLSTIQKMDRIIVVDKGQIVEQGSHQELLRQNGLYASLWAHQSGGFIEE